MRSKKIGKISSKTKTEIFRASVFDTTIHKTERTANQKFVEWINQIIKEKNLLLGIAEQETVGADRKQPDIIIFERPKSEKVLCLIELKPPYFSPFDEKELKKPAWEKANRRKAKYFATSNFKWLIWFNTEKTNRIEPEERQVVDKFHLSSIENLDDIEDARHKNSILKGIEKFLEELVRVHTGIKPEPLLPIDEFLIFRLQEKIYRLAKYYKEIIRDKAHKDAEFSRKLKKWFIEQQWAFTYLDSDFEKAARQTAYLLINKILFYDVLQSKRSGQLDSLTIPDDLTKGGLLQITLQGYFDYVLKKIDYETIYSTDFIDQIAFPENRAVVEEIKELIRILKRYDFSKIGFDIIGRIFERLIPQEERHNLGQYFTNPDIVDLILGFCIKHEDDTVVDPACGAGTFLVRAYQHKRLMNLRTPHQEILKTLWGVDIAKFPAHLSTINLAVNDLSVDENYPQILNEDFFNLSPMEKMGGDDARKKGLSTLSGKTIFIPYPKAVDCVVGNPPYTRQEEITEITGKESYKESMIDKALFDGKRKLADISKRAGIHAYFFVHGTKFLKDGGRFGFIVSNSWMDVDYGKGLQELFLKNYKIIAIIESKVERWFEDADVNTCIIILEKCKDQKKRDENLVRFVYLFKPLRHFIPPAHDMWEKQKQRLDAIENFKKTILFHNNFYQTDEYRIFPKKQLELWEEGLNNATQEYEGSKWSIYTRAPVIVFKLLSTYRKSFTKLSTYFNVGWGSVKTGADDFFYLKEQVIKEKKIEPQFVLEKVVRSPKDSKAIQISGKNLSNYLLIVSKTKNKLARKKVLLYLREGERLGYNLRPTCSSRGLWYDLSSALSKRAKILWPGGFSDRFVIFWNPDKYISDRRLFNLYPRFNNDDIEKAYCAVLNSTLFSLFIEVYLKTVFGQGLLLSDTYAVERLPLINLNVSEKKLSKLLNIFDSLKSRTIESIFKEIGASSPDEVAINKVKPDRHELDKIIMGDILDLTEDDQLEVYRAVVDLVRSRIEKAKSFSKKGKTKEGIDVELLTRTIKEKLGDKFLGHFYSEKILNQKNLKTVKLFHPAKDVLIKNELFGWRLSSGKEHIDCQSEAEAEYLKIWLESGLEKIKVPKDESYILKILPELKALKEKIEKIISDHISSITSQKLQNKILHKLQGELFG